MPYSAEISRMNPSCFLFLIDQSGSMADSIAAGEAVQQKAQGVADTINRWLQELSIKCAKSEGVRDYYYVGVVGYGASVGSAFGGTLTGRELVPISMIAESPARLEERAKRIPDGAGGLVDQKVRFPIWFDPVASGGTPMCSASGEAYRILDQWLKDHPACFPPTVIHITDGESTDGDPSEAFTRLVSLASSDGRTLLFNIHLSANPDAKPIRFPSTPDLLPDEYARMLFRTASSLTPAMRSVAREQGVTVSDEARGFVLNADMVSLIQALDIGTRPSNLR
ncbi:MAG: vWA domain-containing protein [Pirellulales bacterium]